MEKKKNYIYLAGSCSKDQRKIMERVSEILTDKGCEVYCPWKMKIDNAWDMSQEEWAAKVFNKDVEMLDSAEKIIIVSSGRNSSAGTNWEQGYAYAKGKPVYVLQYTQDETSLMTYTGCERFISTKPENIEKALLYLLEEDNSQKQACLTKLT